MALGQITETRTYLTFTLDQEDFAVDVAGVREVLDYTDVTRVPRTPDFMKGVINLRGSVVPVVDMRLKFGLPEAEKTVDTCIIVLEVEMEGEVAVIGAIADSVKEVFELESSQIEPPPRLGTRFDTEFISGMGKYKDDFIIILDVNRVFSNQELEVFRQAEEAPVQPLEEDPAEGDAVASTEGDMGAEDAGEKSAAGEKMEEGPGSTRKGSGSRATTGKPATGGTGKRATGTGRTRTQNK